MPGSAYEAEFTLYPDPDSSERFRSRGSYIARQMSDYGVETMLDATREHYIKEPISEWITGIRLLFEEGYGAANRYGEAFEDGAITGLLVGTEVLDTRIMPLFTNKVGSLIEAYEDEYYGQGGKAGVLFSDFRMQFIEAIRTEGTKGFMEHRTHVSPLSSQITVAKYPHDVEYVHAISQGIGFVLGQLKWAHHDDYMNFATRYEKAQATFVSRETLKNELARQAMDYLDLQPRRQT